MLKFKTLLMGLCFFCLLFSSLLVVADEKENDLIGPPKNVLGGFLAIKGYYDTRDRTMFTFRTLVTLPANFEYFGLLEVFTEFDTPKDLSLYYMEQNLLWKLPKKLPLGFNVQLVSTSGAGNDVAWVLRHLPC